ncbi:MAG: hypothetical protein QOH63_758 [Acidobacteriota bacterium]|jgi:hypothetical protein|nr:hypothetical protein [Acidobacteriota bacterium]
MRFIRKALLVILALIIILAVWIWWNRPRKVDMTAYVPADSLIYIEANDLPEIAGGLASTDAWKALAPVAGIRSGLGSIGWLSRLASWTGIGSADAVVLSRAQIAVAVLGFDAADEGDTLKIKPRYAVVVETHTGESRTRYAIEKRIGDFARRAYGEPREEHKEADGVKSTTWISPDGERRIIAAISGSVAIIGNDESAVQACLAVRRNERPSLKDNPQLEEMRRRVSGNDALAFGYASPEGAARLLELKAITYAGQISSDPRAQSAAASMLPALARKILGGVGWSAHLSNGLIEDHYFIALQNGVGDKLQSALASERNAALTASELLPANTYSISRYSYRDPQSAWRGLNNTVASQFDTLGSILLSRLLSAWLNHYGIEEPDHFLQAIGPEFVTASLDDTESSTVTVVEVRDEKTLRDFVGKRLGAKPRSELIGDAEMLVSNNEKRDAASFVGQHLLLGKAENIRLCLEARKANQTLASSADFKKSTESISAHPSIVVTYTDDRSPARNFIKAMAARLAASKQSPNEGKLDDALGQLRYAASEMRLVEGGFERITSSSFGQFGMLAAQFAPSEN